MRMWNVPPYLMCRKHIFGEHVELHMFAGCLLKKKSLKGFIDKGLVEVHNLYNRHDELVKEMNSRGYKHASPLLLVELYKAGNINILNNIKELSRRCNECKRRQHD